MNLLSRRLSPGNGTRPIGQPARYRRVALSESLEKRELLTGIVWADGPSLMEPLAEAAAFVTGSGQLYLLGGGLGTVEKLSPAATHWGSALDIPKDPTGPAVTQVGNHVLVFGGRYGNQGTEEAFEYDLLMGDSQDFANLLTSRYDHAYAVDGSGNSYAIGGIEQSGDAVFDSVERYDFESDTWSEVAALPSPRVNAVAANDGNGHVMVFGGSIDESGTQLQSTVFSYDVVSDTWSALAAMPVATAESAIAVDATDGKIYIIGGKATSGPTDLVQVYDPINATWTMETPLPDAVYSATAAVDSEGRLHVMGGYDSSGTTLDATWRSQPLHLPDEVPLINSRAVTTGAADKSYSYDVDATGNPPPTFSLAASPDGMTIDPRTGVIGWQPTDAQVGVQAVVVRAENRAGQHEQLFEIEVAADTTAPTVPLNFQVNNVTETTADLSWEASIDAKGIDHYTIFVGRRCGWRGRNTCYGVFRDSIVGTSTSVTLTGLAGSYKLRVGAVDNSGIKSELSNVVGVVMQTPPRIAKYDISGYRTTANATANFEMRARIYALGNPQPTMRMLSGPQGLTFDATTGIIGWIPSGDHVGTHEVVLEASSVVSTVSFTVPITVTPDLPTLDFSVNTASGFVVPGELVEVQTRDSSRTPSTFEIVSGPSGSTIDSDTGLISWTPTLTDVGITSISVRATNAAGSTVSQALIRTWFVSEPTGITPAGESTLEPSVSWTAPAWGATEEMAGYEIHLYRRYRWGRVYRTESIYIDSPGTATTASLSGMKENVAYQVFITPYGLSGEKGVRSTEIVSLRYTPSLPRLRYSITGFEGTSAVVALQPMSMQFTDSNPLSVSTTYELVTTPAGFTLDSATGLASWTPNASSAGTAVNITIRARNTLGTRDLTVPVQVLFSGPVQNLVAVRDGNVAHVSWSAPSTNVDPVEYYQVTRFYRWSSRRRSVTTKIPATSTSIDLGLYPTGAVWHTGVRITPIRADGSTGIGASVPFV